MTPVAALRACIVAAVAALLAGCGGGAPAGPAPLANASVAIRAMPNLIASAEHPDRSASWMRPGAASVKALLYVSDAATDDVDAYDYSSGTAVGKLTGFHHPSGQCVDAAGDVYVTNFRTGTVVEYAHGGSHSLRTLDTNGYAIGCSVAPNGDLAVTNFYTKAGSGNVEVFKNARGTPSAYADPASCYYMWPAGYDNAGNLFVEGETTTPGVCWLPAGGNAMSLASFNQPILFPGSVMWDGKFLTLTDQEYNGAYQTGVYQAVLSSSGGTLREVGITTLTDRCRTQYADVAQPFVVGRANTPVNQRQGRTIVGANAWCAKRFDFWAYPGGGRPSSSLAKAPSQPNGASVSLAATGPLSSRVAPSGSNGCGWIAPAAKNGQPLVYVADGSDVWIFPENGQDPNAAAIGCIDDGVNQAYGLNVDRRGRLYVVNRAGSVTVYKPGSLKPSATYVDSLSQPLYAAIDAGGNLWVSNAGGGTVVEYLRGSIVAHQVLQTVGNEADGLDFDASGNLYVAYRLQSTNGGVEKFASGSTHGEDLGIQLDQPQGVVVTATGALLVVETGRSNRVDLFPAGKSAPKMEIAVPQPPVQLGLTETENQLFVSSIPGTIYATRYPLRRSSAFALKLTVLGGSVQGIALSNGEHH